MSKRFVTPFAASGDKLAIPDATQPDGSVSYNAGFGVDYQRPIGDPLRKTMPRDSTNQLFFDITELLKELQDNGILPWRNDIDYAVGVFVLGSNGTAYRSIAISGPGTAPRDPTTQPDYWTAVVTVADRYVPKTLVTSTSNSINPTDAFDIQAVTALAQNLQINNPSGSWANGQELSVRIRDNGVSRALTWGSKYRAFGSALPANTTTNRTLYVVTKYNATEDFFDVIVNVVQI